MPRKQLRRLEALEALLREEGLQVPPRPLVSTPGERRQGIIADLLCRLFGQSRRDRDVLRQHEFLLSEILKHGVELRSRQAAQGDETDTETSDELSEEQERLARLRDDIESLRAKLTEAGLTAPPEPAPAQPEPPKPEASDDNTEAWLAWSRERRQALEAHARALQLLLMEHEQQQAIAAAEAERDAAIAEAKRQADEAMAEAERQAAALMAQAEAARAQALRAEREAQAANSPEGRRLQSQVQDVLRRVAGRAGVAQLDTDTDRELSIYAHEALARGLNPYSADFTKGLDTFVDKARQRQA